MTLKLATEYVTKTEIRDLITARISRMASLTAPRLARTVTGLTTAVAMEVEAGRFDTHQELQDYIETFGRDYIDHAIWEDMKETSEALAEAVAEIPGATDGTTE